MSMKYQNQLIEYFKIFSCKNIELLSEMFSDDIELVDWDISAKGKSEVIQANKNIFDSVSTIEIVPIHFYSNSNTSYAVQISICIDSNEILKVIDVIKFNNDGLITSINAYKISNTGI
jgi:hypothetical protein